MYRRAASATATHRAQLVRSPHSAFLTLSPRPPTSAIRTDKEVEFSQANIVPMAVAIGTLAPHSLPGAAVNAVFALGYIFFGFVHKKSE